MTRFFMAYELITFRLQIREFNTNDSDFILRLLNSPGWLRFIGDRNIRTEEDAKFYIQNSLLESYIKNKFGLYLVELRDTSTPIGMCGLVKREYLFQPDLGFAFLPEYGKLGYAFEAAKAVLEETKRRVISSGVFGITEPLNTNSIQLLLKLGFSFDKKIQPDGEKEELDLYALNF